MANANSIIKANVRNHGNSLGITIPSPYAKLYGIAYGDELEIDLNDVNIIKAPDNDKKERG